MTVAEKDKATITLPESVDKAIYDLVVQVIKDNPLARTLQEAQISDLAIKSITEGKMSDNQWLQDEIRRIEDESPNIPGSKILKIPVSEAMTVQNQEELNVALDQHATWIQSILHPTKANAGGRINLSGSDFTGLDLDGADLRGANLSHCKFAGCKIIGANFSTANLSQSDFTGARLEKTSLRRCNLSQANFSSSQLIEVDLRKAELDAIDWTETQVEGIKYSDPIPRKLRAIMTGEEAEPEDEAPADEDPGSLASEHAELPAEPTGEDDSRRIAGATASQQVLEQQEPPAPEKTETDNTEDEEDLDGLDLNSEDLEIDLG